MPIGVWGYLVRVFVMLFYVMSETRASNTVTSPSGCNSSLNSVTPPVSKFRWQVHLVMIVGHPSASCACP